MESRGSNLKEVVVLKKFFQKILWFYIWLLLLIKLINFNLKWIFFASHTPWFIYYYLFVIDYLISIFDERVSRNPLFNSSNEYVCRQGSIPSSGCITNVQSCTQHLPTWKALQSDSQRFQGQLQDSREPV